MTELSAPFAPDWVSPPGDSILDIAEERGWTQAELAQRLGYTEKHVSPASEIDSPKSFWVWFFDAVYSARSSK